MFLFKINLKFFLGGERDCFAHFDHAQHFLISQLEKLFWVNYSKADI